MNSTTSLHASTRIKFCSKPPLASVRVLPVRCLCSDGSREWARNAKEWKDVHMPALRDRLEQLQQRGDSDASLQSGGASQGARVRSIKPPVWTIRGAPLGTSSKPHSFRDEYWLRANKLANARRSNVPFSYNTDGTPISLHARFHSYVRDNADRLDISGRPPMPNHVDMALSMDRQWEEMSEEIEKWHKQKWERLAQDQEDA